MVAFESSTVSDTDGDFTISLLFGEYEVRFDGRSPINIVVPDDTENSYNISALIANDPAIIQTVARTSPPKGLNYVFATDGNHYFKNLSTGLWHTYTFEYDPGSPLIGAAANPTPATSIAAGGTNYAFQADLLWKLKNETTGNYHALYSGGDLGSEYGQVAAGAALGTLAATYFNRGPNMRIVGRLQQFFNADLGKWATPYVAGPEAAESIIWFPSVV